MKDNHSHASRFLLLTFGLTYLFWISAALRSTGASGIGQLLLALGGSMPSLVAIGIVATTWDREARRSFWRRCFTLQGVRPLPMLLIFTPLFINSCAMILYGVLSGQALSLGLLVDMVHNPVQYFGLLLTIFIFGPVSEELGWRGYLLDLLRVKFSPARNRYKADLYASLALGILWAAWHLPLFFVVGTVQNGIGLFTFGGFSFMVSIVLISVVYTWQHELTGRNVLVAILFHFLGNLSVTLILASNSDIGPLWNILTIALTAVVVLGVLAAQKGIQRAQSPA